MQGCIPIPVVSDDSEFLLKIFNLPVLIFDG